uniref:Transposase n=1 Tax=Candidatus Kentrum sp. TC TaxID=2126339 RepID=A0A450ZCH8_9GAMM|nr:MAG: Transposase [Candidatus Kentron sp. TC]VFK51510.1 MAG: Transposase [Candidatus Kentron sp. TC]
MGAAYIKVVAENLPKATLVFDHFHIIKRYNEKLSDSRRAIAKNELTVSGIGMLKRFSNTLATLPTMISTALPAIHWREPIIKSKPFRKWHMAFATWNS